MKELLGRTRDFTAVFAVNDLVAIGAMKALREQGLRIPEDISVVGCDDIQFASYMEPALATIRIPKGEMGMLATDMLYDILNGNTCEDTVLSRWPFRQGQVLRSIRHKHASGAFAGSEKEGGCCKRIGGKWNEGHLCQQRLFY